MNNSFALSYLLISLTMGGFIYFVLWVSLQRERFRCEIRRTRDELFDFMWENKYDFKDPNYIQTRAALNVILRASNVVSPILLVALAVIAIRQWRRTGSTEAKSPLPEGKLGEKIYSLYLNLTWTVIEYSFLKGIPGLFIKLTAWILWHTFHRGATAGAKARAWRSRLSKDGADYLRAVGAGAHSPLLFIA